MIDLLVKITSKMPSAIQSTGKRFLQEIKYRKSESLSRVQFCFVLIREGYMVMWSIHFFKLFSFYIAFYMIIMYHIEVSFFKTFFMAFYMIGHHMKVFKLI